MRGMTLVLAALALTACGQAEQAKRGVPRSDAGEAMVTGDKISSAQAGAPVTLTAADGVTVYGRLYAAPDPKAVILLFHQAGSSKGEYATIAPKLVAMGYSALAIDQRSGGDLFGRNDTATKFGHSASYLDVKPDLQAALDWAVPQGKPVILWGSSYSSALVFLVAAENVGKVAAVMAFSPGEYLGQPTLVRDAAAKLKVPVFVTSAKDAEEIDAAAAIERAVPGTGDAQFVPKIGGVHGSSTLIAARNPRGADENWQAVAAFLKRVAPGR